MRTNVGPDPLDRGRFPADPWRLVETGYNPDDLGLTETLFSVANGYLGMRGNAEEGRPSYSHGTFVNGFHETWPIRHAEAAFGFARTGQTIVNVPDAKVMKIYVDDEPLTFGTADLEEYERYIDFRDGILHRNLVWRTPSGKRVRIESTRMVSMTQRHLAVLTVEITMLSGSAPVVVSSQLINRQDGNDEYQGITQHQGDQVDPRKSAAFAERVLIPQMHYATGSRLMLGYKCARSGMTIAAAADHELQTVDSYESIVRAEEDLAKVVYRVDATEGTPMRIEKTVTYHTSRGVSVRELSDRCDRTLDRADRQGVPRQIEAQRDWFAKFWESADVEVGEPDPGEDGRPRALEQQRALQQAIRFNLFSLAQATARADGLGIPAKGVSGSGYEGHYFWDTEIYVVPFLAYTQPSIARNVLHFRSVMLPKARERAREMAQKGALFPWRTISGEEASAYYAAGTAQVHIDADISYALLKYVHATGDLGFLVREGIDILVETARMWADLGFWRHNDESSFHIHGVTGPDEYTTVVNNNLFTNVMARYNLEEAVASLGTIRDRFPQEYHRVVSRLGLSDDEIEEWGRCAAGMHIPYDTRLGIHPQDDFFLDREVWDLPNTPMSVRPLMLHYHPLVIYRFQVLKQADVVLALFLQGDRFTLEEKRKDFEYYDPITTGDSTLSAIVQSIVASEVGYHEAALRYFHDALYVDLGDLHGNTSDGMHIASTGGVWNALVFGFGGMRDHGARLSFDPRLPASWSSLTFRVLWRGSRLLVALTQDYLTITVVEEGDREQVPIILRGNSYTVSKGAPLVLPLEHHGPRASGSTDEAPITGGQRPDGSTITSQVPEPIPFREIGETAEVPVVYDPEQPEL